MTDNVTNIGALPTRTQAWTPSGLLRYLADEMETGRLEEPDSMVVSYMYGSPDTDTCRVGSYHARASGILSLALLDLVKSFIRRDIFGPNG